MTLRSGRSAVASPAEGGGGRPLSERGWQVTLVVHHVVVAVLVGVAMVDAVIEESGAREAVLLAALAVLGLAYATVGGPALVRRDHRRAARYLLVLVLVIGVLAWILPELLFLLFVAFPQVWFMVTDLRSGVRWTLAVGAAATLGPTVHWAQGTEPFDLQTFVGVAFSLAMGAWVTGVLAHSEQRADLIRELESTRAQLADLHHQQGMVAERERLAREVHDTLAQGYTSIVVLAQTAAAVLPGDPDAAAERLAVIEEVARENLAEARAMVAAFAPVALDSATLVEALQRLAERFGRETGIVTRVDTAALGSGGPALSRAEEIVLLRGAQEALANVRRHAAATAVVLRISRVGSADGAQVSVHVEDDGVGFDPAVSAGVGLAGLRDRAEEVGGAVDVRSAPGEGTRVTVRVPVR